MQLSAMGFMGAAATSLALMGCNAANAQPSPTTFYPSATASADIYSPPPPSNYAPQLAAPSASSRVIGHVDVDKSCKSFDCLPSQDDRWKVFFGIIGLAILVGGGSLGLIWQEGKKKP